MKAAWETLSDSDKRDTCNNVVENAKKTLDMEIAEKRKDMRSKHKTVIIPEDDPAVYKQELHKKCVKVNILHFQKNQLNFRRIRLIFRFPKKNPEKSDLVEKFQL